MAIAILSLPGTTDFQAYIEDAEATTAFNFSSYDGSISFQVMVRPCALGDLELPARKPADQQLSKSRKAYLDLLQSTIDHIKELNLGKIVISRYEDLHLEIDPLEFFKILANAYPSACVYLFAHEQWGTWIGATPELLLSGNKHEIQSMSLAGTKQANSLEPFGPKELAEQQMVSEFIESCFEGSENVSNIKIDGPSEVSAGSLIHLQTMFRAKINSNFAPKELLEALHPTPAVCGLPRSAARNFITSNEDYDRAFYTGYFGIEDKSGFKYYVNLRCMQVFSDSLRLYAGGGITAHSVPEKEWEETQNKLRTIKDLILTELEP